MWQKQQGLQVCLVWAWPASSTSLGDEHTVVVMFRWSIWMTCNSRARLRLAWARAGLPRSPHTTLPAVVNIVLAAGSCTNPQPNPTTADINGACSSCCCYMQSLQRCSPAGCLLPGPNSGHSIAAAKYSGSGMECDVRIASTWAGQRKQILPSVSDLVVVNFGPLFGCYSAGLNMPLHLASAMPWVGVTRNLPVARHIECKAVLARLGGAKHQSLHWFLAWTWGRLLAHLTTESHPLASMWLRLPICISGLSPHVSLLGLLILCLFCFSPAAQLGI